MTGFLHLQHNYRRTGIVIPGGYGFERVVDVVRYDLADGVSGEGGSCTEAYASMEAFSV